jgi:putative membrane protein
MEQSDLRSIVASRRILAIGEAKMLKYLTLAVGLLFAASANAQSVGEKSGVNSVLGTSPSTQDFVTQAAMGDMLEIETGKLAEQKAADSKIKPFAKQLIADHQKTAEELKSLISGGKVKANVPPALDSSHQSKVDKLKGLSGADFDKAFDDLQRSAHKDATSLFERYAKGGENADLKAFAAKHLPTLQHHLKMAEDLSANRTTQGQGSR